MAFNPSMLLGIKKRLEIFSSEHPKFPLFLRTVGASNAIAPGSVIEVKITDINGRDYTSNIKLTPNDIETIELFKNSS